MSSAQEPDRRDLPDKNRENHADRLVRLRLEILDAAGISESRSANRPALRPVLKRRRSRAELESLRRNGPRWAETLDLLYEEYTSTRADNGEQERLESELRQKEAELRALRSSAAERDLALQREHEANLQREREKVQDLEQRLAAAESGKKRDEEIREVKRSSHERERELRRAYAERLSAAEQETQRRVAALQDQRESDNRTLIQRQANERASKDEQLHSLKLRQEAESRAYGGRIEELARERATERTSLEEAVAKLREKHEAERSRLQERVTELEESLEEQEAITIELLQELGYTRNSGSHRPYPRAEIEAANGHSEDVRQAIIGLRRLTEPATRLREGVALFNETEHLPVVGAIRKSLGEPEIYAGLQDHGGLSSPTITFVWPEMSWRRYVTDPNHPDEEPLVYLAGSGEDPTDAPIGGMQPNARLDAAGMLALGVRPL